MAELLKTVVIMTITGSVPAIAMFALKPIVKNQLSKTAQYYLWLVVIAALLAPFSRFVALPVNSPVKIADTVDYYFAANEEAYGRAKPYEVVNYDGYLGISEEYQATADSLVPSVWVQELLGWCRLLYGLGAGLCFGYFVLAYVGFYAKLKRRNVATGIKCAVPVYRNALADTPMLLGLFRPVIILPGREYAEAQLQAVLAHELTHLRRKDMLVRWAAALTCAVHWFNPLVWLVRREIDRSCELACDEAVVRDLDTDGKRIYGDTLIAIAAKPKFGGAAKLAMCEEKRDLKERLGAIMKNKKRGIFGAVVSVVLLIALTACAVGIGAGSQNESGLVEFETVITPLAVEANYTIQFRDGDLLYSSYSPNPDEGERPNSERGAEIGYAKQSEDAAGFAIYERKGYPVSEFIIVCDKTLMGGNTVYKAERVPLPPFEEMPDKRIDGAIIDLTEKRDVNIHAEDLSEYRLFTNSKKISYSISGALSAYGKLILYDADTGYSIMEADLSKSTKGEFTNLTASKTYYLTIPIADDTVIVLND
jgi:beta-lactamase regulating signal transducer with metallopeptidase domain